MEIAGFNESSVWGCKSFRGGVPCIKKCAQEVCPGTANGKCLSSSGVDQPAPFNSPETTQEGNESNIVVSNDEIVSHYFGASGNLSGQGKKAMTM